jgi:tetratricopeptide (TPR) repeat protein
MLVSLSVLSLLTLADGQSASLKTPGFSESKQGLREVAATPAERPSLTPEMRGDIYMARKMFREAADMYRQMPDTLAVSWNKVGIAHHQMLDLNGARRAYERALKIDGDYAEAINNLGTVFYAQKNFRKSIGYYRRALKVNPRSASVLSNLGTACFARKRYDEAFQAYQEALAIDPEVFEHRNSAGVLLQERSVEERAKFHFYLAKTYARAGNVERTMLYLRKALEEGFKERARISEDPEFAAMRALPEFQELLKYQPKVL